jgi:hypothetical protein
MIARRVLQHAGAENTLRATRLGSLAANGSLLIGAGALALALGACSAGDEADGMPTYGNVPAFGSNGNGAQNNNTAQNPAANGSASNSGSTQSPAASNSNSNGSQSNPPAQQNGSQNSGAQTGSAQEGNPGTAPISNGNNNNGASNSGSAGSAGNNTGSAGSSGNNTGSAGSSGNNGAMAPGAGGNTGNPMPPVNNGNQNPPPPTTPDITCPSGASFCSGFESAALPSGTVFQPTGTQPQFDTAVKHSGNQSIVFPAGSGGFSVKEVVAPIPGQTFWARLFVQVSSTFGDNDHDSLFVASTATTTEDNNAEHGPELSEQGNQILLNADDALFNAAGPGFPSASTGPTISANTWHCIEAFYDGGTGDVQIFGDSQMLINAPAYKKLTYSTFRFGYIQFNTARTIHFDDVVVAPDRVGCGN